MNNHISNNLLMRHAKDILADNLSYLMGKSARMKSQNSLGKASKVGQTTIGNILRQDSSVKSTQFDVLEKLAKTFGVTVAQLFTENLGRNPVASHNENESTNPYHSDIDRLINASSGELRQLIETLVEAEASHSISQRATRSILSLVQEMIHKPAAGKNDWPGLSDS